MKMKIDFDAEARRGELTIETEQDLVGSVVLCLTQDEIIDLYKVLREEIGDYVAEMEAYALEFAQRGTVGGWSPEEHALAPGGHPAYEALADAADLARKREKGE